MRLASFSEAGRTALETLRAHPLRSVLSTLGVMVGVMALTAAFAVTDGVNAWARYLIERESSVQDIVLSSRPVESLDGIEVPRHGYPVFTLDDWKDAGSTLPDVSGALLTATGSSRATMRGHHRAVQLTLTTANLPALTSLDLQSGRFFTEAEVNHHANVAVLNAHLAGALAAPFEPGWALGRSLWLNGRPVQVVGILAPLPGENEDVAFAPVSRPGLIAGQAPLPVLRIKAASIEAVPAVREAAVDWVARRQRGDLRSVNVEVGLERLQRSRQAILLSKLLLGFLVGLMLTIGGIGIMNIMLASVAERTEEIGIRKSVGARSLDIHAQFLIESLVIAGTGSLVGFLAGAALATGGTAVFRHFTEARIYPMISGSVVAWVVLATVTVGLVFGTYPARRAARLTVIQAIART